MIYSDRKNINQVSYNSNRRIIDMVERKLKVIYSLLFKSLRRGDEKMALYAADHITSMKKLKELLIIFMCENCPMFYMVKSFIDLNITTQEQIKAWIIRLCRIHKTRIIVNAFRVVSFEHFKPSNKSVSINDINHINLINDVSAISSSITTNNSSTHDTSSNDNNNSVNDVSTTNNNNTSNDTSSTSTQSTNNNNSVNDVSNMLSSNDTSSAHEIANNNNSVNDTSSTHEIAGIINEKISVDDEKRLINNTYIIWKLLCQNGIKQAMKDIFTTSDKLFERIYKLLDKKYLDVVFLYLSFVSLSYGRSLEYITLNLDVMTEEVKRLTPDIPEFIPQRNFPNYVFDMYVPINKRSNTSYKFFFDNLVINPMVPLTKTDKFGIQKFISIGKPLDSSTLEYIKVPEVENIYLARFQTFNEQRIITMSLYTTNKLKPRYKKMIYMTPFKEKETVKHYIFCDYLKSKLGLNSLNRQIIFHDDKYYMVQKNIFPVHDEGYFQKNNKRQTIYIYPVESFKPAEINQYAADEELLLKILEMLIFHHVIGHCSTERYCVVIYENQVYSLTDRIRCVYYKTFFTLSQSTQTEAAFKQIIDQHWEQILKILKRFYRVISADTVININMKMLILYHIELLKDKNNWIFSEINKQANPSIY